MIYASLKLKRPEINDDFHNFITEGSRRKNISHTDKTQTGEAEGETQAKVMLTLTFGELNNW